SEDCTPWTATPITVLAGCRDYVGEQ
nr:RecName: Full=Alpha-amylase inhibitor [Secale cereale]